MKRRRNLFILFLCLFLQFNFVFALNSFVNEQEIQNSKFSETKSKRYKAIIHIGPHKTSSTDIQQNLIGNFQVFKKLGWFVIGHQGPKFGSIFANTIRGDRIHQQSTENALDLITMLEEIKNCSQNIVISSESFEKFSLMHAKKLASLLSCFQVEIVAFHRQTIDLIRSNWSQSEKKHLAFVSFPEYFLRAIDSIEKGTDDHHFGVGFANVIQTFKSAFEPIGGKVQIISFEGSIKQFGSPFNALLELTFKIPVKTFHQTPNVQQFPKQNVSPSSFQFDIIQSLQKYSDYKDLEFNVKTAWENVNLAESLLPKQVVVLHVPNSIVEKEETFLNSHKVELFDLQNTPLSRQISLEMLCTSCLRKQPFKQHWQRLLSLVFRNENE